MGGKKNKKAQKGKANRGGPGAAVQSPAISAKGSSSPKGGGEKLKRGITFRNFINGAKEKLLHGLKKKSDPKMLLSESTNSSAYNTALATTPANSDSQSDGNPMTMPFGLSKSAKRKQKMMAKLKASSTTVAIPLQLSHCTVEDLYSWCCDVADSSRPEEERAASLENVADALARTDDFMERLLIRKLASNWGVPSTVGEMPPEGVLNKRLLEYLEDEKKGSTTAELMAEVQKKEGLATLMKHLMKADEQTVNDVLKMLTRPRAPSDPAHSPSPKTAVAPKTSQTYSMTIKTESVKSERTLAPINPNAPPPPPLPPSGSRLLAPVTGGPPPPPLPPPLLASAKGGPPAGPPPPPPGLCSSSPFAQPMNLMRTTNFDKSGRTISVRISHRRPRLPAMEALKTAYSGQKHELSPAEKEVLEKLFADKAEATPVRIRHFKTTSAATPATPVCPQIDHKRAMNVTLVMRKFTQPIADVLERLERGQLDDEDELNSLKSAWPSAEESEMFGGLDRPSGLCELIWWEMARKPHLKEKLDILLESRAIMDNIETHKKDLKQWLELVEPMRHEPFFCLLLQKLVTWTNFLNQGSMYGEVSEISFRDVDSILDKKSTEKGEETTIGQQLMKTLDVGSSELQKIKDRLQVVDGLAPFSELEGLVTATGKKLDNTEKMFDSAHEDMREGMEKLKKEFSNIKMMLERIRAVATDVKRFFREDEKVAIDEILAQQLKAVRKCLDAVTKVNPLRSRSVSLIDVSNPMERSQRNRRSMHILPFAPKLPGLENDPQLKNSITKLLSPKH